MSEEADVTDSVPIDNWWYQELQIQYNVQQNRACEAEAREARLREVLKAIEWVKEDDGRFGCAECGNYRDKDHTRLCVFAALSTTTADWLERHDAEVTHAERERCAGKCDEAEALAEEEARGCSPHGNLQEQFLAKAGQASALATAIREGEKDDV